MAEIVPMPHALPEPLADAIADHGTYALCDQVCGRLRRQFGDLDQRLGGAR